MIYVTLHPEQVLRSIQISEVKLTFKYTAGTSLTKRGKHHFRRCVNRRGGGVSPVRILGRYLFAVNVTNERIDAHYDYVQMVLNE